MKQTIHLFIVSLVVLASISLSSCCSNDGSSQAGIRTLAVVETPDQGIEALKIGNQRFMADSLLFPNSCLNRVGETAPKQKPFVAIVSCSDSRVPVELIFDQGIGDMFVVRTAGNIVNDDITMGSVDYAVCHLDVKLVVVLGHTSCGGIAGAIAPKGNANEPRDDGKVGALLEILQKDVKQFVGSPDKIDEAIATNVHSQVAKLLLNEPIAQRVAKGQIKVVPAVYDVHSGKVTFL